MAIGCNVRKPKIYILLDVSCGNPKERILSRRIAPLLHKSLISLTRYNTAH